MRKYYVICNGLKRTSDVEKRIKEESPEAFELTCQSLAKAARDLFGISLEDDEDQCKCKCECKGEECQTPAERVIVKYAGGSTASLNKKIEKAKRMAETKRGERVAVKFAGASTTLLNKEIEKAERAVKAEAEKAEKAEKAKATEQAKRFCQQSQSRNAKKRFQDAQKYLDNLKAGRDTAREIVAIIERGRDSILFADTYYLAKQLLNNNYLEEATEAVNRTQEAAIAAEASFSSFDRKFREAYPYYSNLEACFDEEVFSAFVTDKLIPTKEEKAKLAKVTVPLFREGDPRQLPGEEYDNEHDIWISSLDASDRYNVYIIQSNKPLTVPKIAEYCKDCLDLDLSPDGKPIAYVGMTIPDTPVNRFVAYRHFYIVKIEK